MTVLLSRPVPVAVVPVAPGRGRAASTIRWTSGALGVLALWFAGYVLVIGSAQETGAQQKLYAQFRAQLSHATAPLGATGAGRPVALLNIPSLGLTHLVVVEGTTSRQLQTGPGHRRDTVLPGQAGISLVYAKGSTFGAPFSRLGRLRTGDQLTVLTAQGSSGYRVTGTRHPGDPLPPLPAKGSGRLTLATAVSGGWRAAWAGTRTVYVDATVNKAKPAAAARTGTAPSERLLASDRSGMLALVLWLEALLIVVVGAVWASSVWGRWQTWLVAAPALVAVLVLCSGTAAQLLPNVL